MRCGVDYLVSCDGCDPHRRWMFGGTSTAYFAALDDRVKVAASAAT
jgi:hypothetical protein